MTQLETFVYQKKYAKALRLPPLNPAVNRTRVEAWIPSSVRAASTAACPERRREGEGWGGG